MQITIKNLRLQAVIGVHEWEQRYARQFTLQVQFDYDATRAAAMDDLHYAIDYTAVEACLMQFIGGRSWGLIETVAQQSAEHLLERFPPIEQVHLSIEKPQAMHASESVAASVTVQRGTVA
jgi:dihydroneopterin aldolase